MTLSRLKSRCLAALVLGSCAAMGWTQETTCESLTSTKLPHAQVTDAVTVAASESAAEIAFPYCRIDVTSRPTADSEIHIEMWVPVGDKWNGKYVHVGNGGFSGSISKPGLTQFTRLGFATSNTDNGHQAAGSDGSWAVGHPERIKDYGYRSLKETTEVSKALLSEFKRARAHYSYFYGCSGGGRDALIQAQRYPEDFDGIVAGAPAAYMTHLVTAGAWTQQALNGVSVGPAQLLALQKAALAACGATNGYIPDPSACRFDPKQAQCTAGQAAEECLTASQVAAVQKIYDGPKNSRTGKSIFPGYSFGEETGWIPWIIGPNGSPSLLYGFAKGLYGGMVFGRNDFNPLMLDLVKDTEVADSKIGPAINAIEPNLTKLKSHGTKLLQYHGANDPAIPVQSSIDYFTSVQDKMGNTDNFYRLFIVPGMLHCLGGAGPSSVDWFSAMEDWVEKSTPPDRLIARLSPPGPPFSPPAPPSAPGARSQALCPYPKRALYVGNGDLTQAPSYQCSP